jgi:hypothetical protein
VLQLGLEAVRTADGDSIFLHIDTTLQSTNLDAAKQETDNAARKLACHGGGSSEVDNLLAGTSGIE